MARQHSNRGGLSDPAAPFRLAIDRVLSIEGHGTVVTGSVSSGSVAIGDKLVIQPGGMEARVREIQNHDLAVQTIARGQRGAINLAGVHHGSIRRGQELCTAGHLIPTRIVTARLSTLTGCSRPLKDRQRIRFHIGTSEVLATVRLIGQRELAPGSQGLAQFFLSTPIVSVWNQPFVIRNESPVETIGGGRILYPNASRLRRVSAEALKKTEELASNDPARRVAASLFLDSRFNHELDNLARIAGVAQPGPIVESLVESGEVIQVTMTTHKTLFVHRLFISQVAEQIVEYLHRFHRADPLASGVQRQNLENHFAFLSSKELFNLAIRQLTAEQKIQLTGYLVVRWKGRVPRINGQRTKAAGANYRPICFGRPGTTID